MSEMSPQTDAAAKGERVHIETPEEISSFRQPPGFIEIHKAKTAGQLAMLAFLALLLMFVAHFVTILLLARGKPDAIEQVNRVFSTWVPVMAGIVGSAATFYFTQERR